MPSVLFQVSGEYHTPLSPACLWVPCHLQQFHSCKADWRLNLVLNPGVGGFPEKVPVFEPGTPVEVEEHSRYC
eukprot:1591762-Amphidinium_carterae.1